MGIIGRVSTFKCENYLDLSCIFEYIIFDFFFFFNSMICSCVHVK